jgi:AcrR family transcriptional regulator
MPRPKTIRDEVILDAAREVFLEHGFQATTAEVAQRAQVSEGSVFKRFKSKFELFHHAMLPSLESVDWTRGLEARVGKGDLRENLHDIAHQAIAFFRGTMPLMMMSWSNPDPAGPSAIFARIEGEPPPVKAIKRVTSYLEAEMRLGRLRRVDPEVLARTFTGGILQFVMFEVMLHVGGMLPLAEATFVRGLVDVLWNGAGVSSPSEVAGSATATSERPVAALPTAEPPGASPHAPARQSAEPRSRRTPSKPTARVVDEAALDPRPRPGKRRR